VKRRERTQRESMYESSAHANIIASIKSQIDRYCLILLNSCKNEAHQNNASFGVTNCTIRNLLRVWVWLSDESTFDPNDC
jgi:hypothetical protein